MTATNVWDEREYLFHYTTQAGLEGILNSQCLHATHYAYLNDEAEVTALRPKLLELAIQSAKETLEMLARRSPDIKRKMEKDGGVNEIAIREAEVLVGKLYRLTFGGGDQKAATSPFVVSFCAHDENAYEFKHGLLSQWRAYGKNIGYALVFDAKKLGELFLEQGAINWTSGGHFSDVVYDGDDEKFRAEFSTLLECFKNFYPRFITGDFSAISELYIPFTSSTSRFKHRAFREENEVRIVFCPCDDDDVKDMKLREPAKYEEMKSRTVLAREFKEGFVPYIKLLQRDGRQLPITRIIVGPHFGRSESAKKIAQFLQFKGLDIPVEISQTPLR
jgi:hypothetical protein